MRSTLPLSRRDPATSIAPGVRGTCRERAKRPPSAVRKGARARTAPDSGAGSAARVRSLRYGLALVLLVIAAIWLLAASRWIVDRHGRAVGRQEPVLCLLPFPRDRHPFRPGAVLESLSLWRAPERRRSAIADLRAAVRAVGAVRSVAVDPRLRPHRLRAPCCRRTWRSALLGWRAGWPAAASMLAAVIFMFGGPASGRLQHTGIILSYGLFPGGAAASCRWRCSAARWRSRPLSAWWRRRWRSAATTRPCCCASCSSPRSWPRSSRPSDSRRYLRERRAVLATMGVVAAALLAVPLLLTMQFAALSNRPEVPLDTALEASLYPANLASLAVANVLGSLETTQVYWGPNFDTLPEVGATDRSFNYLFVGAASDHRRAVVRRCRRMDGAARHASDGRRAGGRAALRAGPLHARLCPGVPVRAGHRPVPPADRRHLRGGRGIALVAGQLLADYVREGMPRVAPWRVAAVGLGALGVIGWAVLFSERTHHGWASLWQVLKVAPLALIVIAVLARARTPHARAMAAACVAAVATAELIWFNAASSLNAEAPAYYSVLQQPAGADAQALVRARARDRRPAPGGRAAAHRGRGRERLVAEPRHGTRPGGDQRLQSAADRLLRPARLARRDDARRRPAAVPRLVRRLRLRARARAGAASTWCWAGRSTRCRISPAARFPTC